ncbi:MAG: prepilin-type N-terminal cleavage/methylation domain-containing protein [Burkholderiaceae bacterium]|nr:prepilin-type N-terminal cleavage/methylation domain-containing protein [Burkholderiaceae bacterium]
MRPAFRRRAGLTLIELMIALAVLALLVAASVPGFQSIVGRHRLQAAAQHLRADLALARQLAMDRATDVHLSFHPGPQWCYVLSLGGPADCHSSVAPGLVIKRVRAEQFPLVRLDEAQAMVLAARSGTSNAGPREAHFATPRGERLTVRLGIPGRASVCSETGALGQSNACPARRHEEP